MATQAGVMSAFEPRSSAIGWWPKQAVAVEEYGLKREVG
jgi:hypothetical protein